MRTIIATLLTVLAVVGLAATLVLPAAAQERTRPPNLQPVPEPPPPPKGFELDSALEPQVTAIQRGDEMAEEYRLGGKLYMIKITPRGGVPYYLVDHHGNGIFARQSAHDTGLRPPMWVIYSF